MEGASQATVLSSLHLSVSTNKSCCRLPACRELHCRCTTFSPDPLHTGKRGSNSSLDCERMHAVPPKLLPPLRVFDNLRWSAKFEVSYSVAPVCRYNITQAEACTRVNHPAQDQRHQVFTKMHDEGNWSQIGVTVYVDI